MQQHRCLGRQEEEEEEEEGLCLSAVGSVYKQRQSCFPVISCLKPQ